MTRRRQAPKDSQICSSTVLCLGFRLDCSRGLGWNVRDQWSDDNHRQRCSTLSGSDCFLHGCLDNTFFVFCRNRCWNHLIPCFPEKVPVRERHTYECTPGALVWYCVLVARRLFVSTWGVISSPLYSRPALLLRDARCDAGAEGGSHVVEGPGLSDHHQRKVRPCHFFFFSCSREACREHHGALCTK